MDFTDSKCHGISTSRFSVYISAFACWKRYCTVLRTSTANERKGFYYVCRHGVRQFLTRWADGPEFITQCPIRPGGSYTYRFTITGQEGTLWWHAHTSWLRATVYGALIISPSMGTTYPFTKPHGHVPILLGMLVLFLFFMIPN